MMTVAMNCMYALIKFYHWLAIQFRYCFRSSRPYTTVNYTIVYPDHVETHAIIPRELPAGTTVVKNYTRHTLRGHVDIRSCILPNDPKDPFAPVQPPWWFIGAKIEAGDEICLTDLMSSFVVVGNTITPGLLNAMNHDIEQCNPTWFYIHPERFDEVVIPPEGITVYGVDSEHVEEELPHED